LRVVFPGETRRKIFMESKAKFLGHPIHQMMIVLPLGTLVMSIVSDIIAMITGNNFWYQMAFYLIAAGVITGAASAVFGLVDYLAIPSGTRAKRIGAMHGIGNAIVLAMFAVSWYLRYQDPNMTPGNLAITLSLLAFGLSGATAWLGGELVDRLGVGVDDGANLDAPSSLTDEKVHGAPFSSEAGRAS
jgi:uncharacterized membrane protein